MRPVKGIKGIRKFLAEGAHTQGWHVFLDDDYVAYFTGANAYEIHATLERTTKLEIEFLGWTGNGLSFRSN